MKVSSIFSPRKNTIIAESMDKEKAEWYERYLNKKKAAQDTNTIDAYAKIVRDVAGKVQSFVPDIVSDGGGYDDVKTYVITVFGEDYGITADKNIYFELLVKSVMDDVCGSKEHFDEARADAPVRAPIVQPQNTDQPPAAADVGGEPAEMPPMATPQ